MQYETSANHQVPSSGTRMSYAVPNGTTASLSTMEQAILQTVTYVDMYDYPLTASEIHRYLVGVPAELPEVVQALDKSRLVKSLLGKDGEYFFLAGRPHIVDIRRRRARKSMTPDLTDTGIRDTCSETSLRIRRESPFWNT